MEKTIETKVCALVAEVLRCPVADVRVDSRFIEDLEANSLDLVELACLAEGEFGKMIPEGKLAAIRTVADVITLLHASD